MAGIRWPPEDSDLVHTRTLTNADLMSDDDRSVAADSWSIKSEYGSTLDDEQRHVDASELLSSGTVRAASDYSSDKDEPDDEAEPSLLGLQSYWDTAYVEELANFREHGHTGEIWFGIDVMEAVACWSKELCLGMQTLTDDGDSQKSEPLMDDGKCLSTWSVLDVGTGNGLLLQEFAKHGFSDLTGIDYSEAAVILARNLADRDGYSSIKFLVDDILETNLDRQFKLILDKGTLDAIGLHPDGPLKRF